MFWIGKNKNENITEEKMKEIRSQCSQDIEAYYQLTYSGALHISEARFQPIEEILQNDEWERLDLEDEKLKKRKKVMEMK